MDEIFMLAALAQSRKALPECLPNPPVGCVIVDAEEIVAQGYTRVPGKYHAEANALNQIQGQAFDLLKMYVTLEPCSFHGRTPACALAIAEDPRIHEIYVSIVDPDPRNNGQGLDILRKAGKTVGIGLCANGTKKSSKLGGIRATAFNVRYRSNGISQAIADFPGATERIR